MLQWKWMTNDAALEIVEWEYEGDYEIYNLQNDMDDLDEFLNPFHWNHYAAVYEEEDLVGFFTFGPKDINTVEIGLGLKPELTGEGRGKSFVEYAVETAEKWYDPKLVTAEVAEFNKRAVRVYEKAGFNVTGTYIKKTRQGERSYMKMEKKIKD